MGAHAAEQRAKEGEKKSTQEGLLLVAKWRKMLDPLLSSPLTLSFFRLSWGLKAFLRFSFSLISFIIDDNVPLRLSLSRSRNLWFGSGACLKWSWINWKLAVGDLIMLGTCSLCCSLLWKLWQCFKVCLCEFFFWCREGWRVKVLYIKLRESIESRSTCDVLRTSIPSVSISCIWARMLMMFWWILKKWWHEFARP